MNCACEKPEPNALLFCHRCGGTVAPAPYTSATTATPASTSSTMPSRAEVYRASLAGEALDATGITVPPSLAKPFADGMLAVPIPPRFVHPTRVLSADCCAGGKLRLHLTERRGSMPAWEHVSEDEDCLEGFRWCPYCGTKLPEVGP